MPDGTSLFDHFGLEWTLIVLSADCRAAEAFEQAAAAQDLSLKVLVLADNPIAADLYAAPAALIRPDQVVCWRGDLAQAAEAGKVLATALGQRPNKAD